MSSVSTRPAWIVLPKPDAIASSSRTRLMRIARSTGTSW